MTLPFDDNDQDIISYTRSCEEMMLRQIEQHSLNSPLLSLNGSNLEQNDEKKHEKQLIMCTIQQDEMEENEVKCSVQVVDNQWIERPNEQSLYDYPMPSEIMITRADETVETTKNSEFATWTRTVLKRIDTCVKIFNSIYSNLL